MTTTSEGTEREVIGARIRELRQARGITGAELAATIGCSDSHVYNIEAGRSRATYDTRLAIAKALGVSVAELSVGILP